MGTDDTRPHPWHLPWASFTGWCSSSNDTWKTGPLLHPPHAIPSKSLETWSLLFPRLLQVSGLRLRALVPLPQAPGGEVVEGASTQVCEQCWTVSVSGKDQVWPHGPAAWAQMPSTCPRSGSFVLSAGE